MSIKLSDHLIVQLNNLHNFMNNVMAYQNSLIAYRHHLENQLQNTLFYEQNMANIMYNIHRPYNPVNSTTNNIHLDQTPAIEPVLDSSEVGISSDNVSNINFDNLDTSSDVKSQLESSSEIKVSSEVKPVDVNDIVPIDVKPDNKDTDFEKNVKPIVETNTKPSNTKPSNTKPSKTESTKTKSSKTESTKTESTKTESTKTESTKTELIPSDTNNKNNEKYPLINLKNVKELLYMFPKVEARAFSYALDKFPYDLYSLEQNQGIKPSYEYLKYQIHLNNVTFDLSGKLFENDPRIDNDPICNGLWTGINSQIWNIHNNSNFKIISIKRWLNVNTDTYTMTILLQVYLNDKEIAQVEEKLDELRQQ